MVKRGIRVSHGDVHYASSPGKATLTDVGLTLGGPTGRPSPAPVLAHGGEAPNLEGGPVQ
jgi:hypothetical protein